VDEVKNIAHPNKDGISMLDVNDPVVLVRAKMLATKSVPAVVIDDRIAECCVGHGPDVNILRAAAVGSPTD
jgi:hypothetical protein